MIWTSVSDSPVTVGSSLTASQIGVARRCVAGRRRKRKLVVSSGPRIAGADLGIALLVSVPLSRTPLARLRVTESFFHLDPDPPRWKRLIADDSRDRRQ
jgi:hypothetical protein